MSTEQNSDQFIDPSAGENAGRVPMEEGGERLPGSMEGINPVEDTEERVEDIKEESPAVLSGAVASLSPLAVPLEEEETLFEGVADFDAPPVIRDEEVEEIVSITTAVAEVAQDEGTRNIETFEQQVSLMDSKIAGEEQQRRAKEEDGQDITLEEGIRRDGGSSRMDFYSKSPLIDEDATEEEKEAEVERFEDAFADDETQEKLGINEEESLLPQLENKVLESPESREEVREVLMDKGGYSEEEADEFLDYLVSNEAAGNLDRIRNAQFLTRVAEEDKELFDEMMQAEDIDAFVRERAGEVEIFREFVEEQQQVEQLRQKFLQEQATALQMEQPGLDTATALKLIDVGVSRADIANLPPESLDAVNTVVANGGARVLGTLLANGVSVNNEEFVGKISDQFVSLNFANGELYLVGENAADRANQSYYTIDPPTPQGFETVLIHSIGEQNRMPYVAENGPQAAAIWERLVGDPSDESFPKSDKINRFRNFLVLLIGEGNPDSTEEGDRLAQLGVLNNSGSVDRSRVDLFAEALEKYVPNGLVMHEGDSPVSGSSESPSFNFQDALTLATLWDTASGIRFPESINELKDLTEKRIGGEDISSVRYV